MNPFPVQPLFFEKEEKTQQLLEGSKPFVRAEKTLAPPTVLMDLQVPKGKFLSPPLIYRVGAIIYKLYQPLFERATFNSSFSN